MAISPRNGRQTVSAKLTVAGAGWPDSATEIDSHCTTSARRCSGSVRAMQRSGDATDRGVGGKYARVHGRAGALNIRPSTIISAATKRSRDMLVS
jgi:hypothetical protein